MDKRKIFFLLPDTTFLSQPMDQRNFASFKAYYVRKTFEQAVSITTGDDAISLSAF
jgi:hypothetical protein